METPRGREHECPESQCACAETRAPVEQERTPRERLVQALSKEPVSARALSKAVSLTEREVVAHLQHLQKTLKTQNRRLILTPATCLDCQFVFQKRERLTRPGKCPVCRSTHLSEPLFSLDGDGTGP